MQRLCGLGETQQSRYSSKNLESAISQNKYLCMEG
jgi:hypothetical protein